MTALIYLIPITIGLVLLLLVIYIIYKHKSNNFEDATTDDGDNEFEQLEKIIEDLEKLSEKRIYD